MVDTRNKVTMTVTNIPGGIASANPTWSYPGSNTVLVAHSHRTVSFSPPGPSPMAAAQSTSTTNNPAIFTFGETNADVLALFARIPTKTRTNLG